MPARVETRFDPADPAVHVWCIRLGSPGREALAELERALSADERARADRFAFERLRVDHIVSTGSLRFLLSRYTGIAPERIDLVRGPRGKPSLRDAPGAIEFNLSHSSGLAVVALTRGCPLGVDVEGMRTIRDLPDLARSTFAPEETADLLALPDAERQRAFFRCWTRKEAYIKAIGEGLYEPLDRFRVTLRPDEPARFVHIGGDREEAARWTLDAPTLESPYVAALAYAGPRRPLSLIPPIQPVQFLG